MRPDKASVVDEVWDDERIESFLDKPPMGNESSADYSILLNAYRSMRPQDFDRFLKRFIATGRDVNACSNSGATLLGTITDHRRAAPFRDILSAQSADGSLKGG